MWVTLPDEDLRSDSPRRDSSHDRLRIRSRAVPRLIDPLEEATARQPQPSRIDHVDDHQRHASIECQLDGNALGRRRNGAELGRKHDRPIRPWS